MFEGEGYKQYGRFTDPSTVRVILALPCRNTGGVRGGEVAQGGVWGGVRAATTANGEWQKH